MCHYPFESWKHKEKGAIHLHGHVHGKFEERNTSINRFDMCVEVLNYTPISIDSIIQKII